MVVTLKLGLRSSRKDQTALSAAILLPAKPCYVSQSDRCDLLIGLGLGLTSISESPAGMSLLIGQIVPVGIREEVLRIDGLHDGDHRRCDNLRITNDY
jgi:hypothetical protein